MPALRDDDRPPALLHPPRVRLVEGMRRRDERVVLPEDRQLVAGHGLAKYGAPSVTSRRTGTWALISTR